jgi:hypothetical protein
LIQFAIPGQPEGPRTLCPVSVAPPSAYTGNGDSIAIEKRP